MSWYKVGMRQGVWVAWAAAVVAAACGSETIESDPGTGGGGVTSSSAETTTSSSATTSSSSGMGGMATTSTGGAGGGGPLTAASCFADDFVNMSMLGPDYDQFGPVIGSHCRGTNHQNITGVERVVFLGDSVTVGSPPTLAGDFYRTKLADMLAAKFSLASPNVLWRNADFFNGKTVVQDSGDFSSCSEWGARTDDFAPEQLPDCFPPSTLNERTLVVITMGGNDVNNLAQDAIDGMSEMDLWTQTQAFVQLQRDAVEWLTAPGRFPNGVFVVFANIYEFTDGTGDVESCDVSGLAGFDEPVPSPAQLEAMVIWANEQYMKIAVDTGTDMIFMLEDFCGHGFNRDDPTAPCYRGPGQDAYFDLTCIHPNPTGHNHIAGMFMSVIDE